MNDERAFYDMVRTLMCIPCLILMRGIWRTGKTDTSLLIAYLAKQWGLIDKIGSNIWTYENPTVEYITSMGSLKRWLHADRLTKLYIFDEALSHLYRKKAMSKKNVGVTAGIVPEISKAHGRIIFCAQTEKIDSDLLSGEFLRAVMVKHSKKVMSVQSDLFEGVTFTDIPRSPIRFDKDRCAEFNESETLGFDTLSLEVKCAVLYADKKTYAEIAKELGLFRTEVKRNVQKVLKAWLKGERLNVVGSPEPASSATVEKPELPA